ncbi:sigma-54 interaction domain-containing protein [Bacillus alveayuensis]|uniref:sigma-54 interaction domain-containing protein n=1 Tax=Aeribacillus alveayuensis TaxID=279215 RepID=UPI0005D0F81A|nr:sigma 54-interacting transcriptional regulator [Bacillus alveayuensis]
MIISTQFKKGVKQKLDELMKLFDLIITSSYDGIYVCDKNGNTLLVNESLLKITNLSKEVLFSYNVFELVKKNIIPNSCSTETIKSKKIHNTIIDYYNGKKALLTSTPVFNESGELLFVVTNVRDITKLIRLEQELEESNKKISKMKNQLYQYPSHLYNENGIVFRSKKMMDVLATAEKFSMNDSPVLILGESGVGKDVLAEYIHKKSGRTGEFIRVNCGAIPEHLLESELFGYEKGAFTGANTSKAGLFEAAHNGTIFLDEIGDLPYHLQVKLLNVLQDKKIRRLGNTKTRAIDMRVISATNIDLNQLIGKKKFREDLYYRLNVLTLTIPPLRERKEDIPSLIYHFLYKLEQKYGVRKHIQNEAMDILLAYHWPGNIRELNNIIERMYHMSDHNLISTQNIPNFIYKNLSEIEKRKTTPYYIEQSNLPLKDAIERFEKNYIENTLKHSKTLKECAEKLKVDISTLVRKKKKLGIQ